MPKIKEVISSALARVAPRLEANEFEVISNAVLQALNGADGVLIYSKEVPEKLKLDIEDVKAKLKVMPVITDQATADAINKDLKEAKRLISAVEASALELRRPASEIAKDIIALEKQTVADLQALVNLGNQRCVDFAKLQDKLKKDAEEKIRLEAEQKAAAELARVTGIREKISKFNNSVLTAVMNATTPDECDEKIGKLDTITFNPEMYQEFLNEVAGLIPTLRLKFLEKKAALIEAQENMKENGEDPDKALKEIQAAEAEKIEEQKRLDAKKLDEAKVSVFNAVSQEAEVNTAMLKGGKASKPLKYAGLVDITKVPLQYLCVDEKAVKAAIKSGVREIAGLKIEEDYINVSR